MSKNSKSNSKKVAPAPQPYCAHCFNLGKDESVFRSHWLRESPDSSSKIVCPELLATECPYCFKPGHTRSRCPVLIAQDKVAKKEEWRRKTQVETEAKAKVEQSKKTQTAKGSSKFAALMEDSDSEDEKQVINVSKNIKISTILEDFPALSSSKKVVPTATQSNSYAAMALKTKSEYEDEQYLKSKLIKAVVPPMPKLVREQTVDVPLNRDGFWVDYDSTEEDEADYIERKMSQKKVATQLSITQWLDQQAAHGEAAGP